MIHAQDLWSLIIFQPTSIFLYPIHYVNQTMILTEYDSYAHEIYFIDVFKYHLV